MGVEEFEVEVDDVAYCTHKSSQGATHVFLDARTRNSELLRNRLQDTSGVLLAHSRRPSFLRALSQHADDRDHVDLVVERTFRRFAEVGCQTRNARN